MTMQILKKSIIWNKSCDMALEIYRLTEKLPIEEKYGLKSQMKRCAISIPSNISEGLFRKTKNEMAHFMVIAKGSCGELLTQLIICQKLGYIRCEEFEKSKNKITEIIKILFAITQTLKTSN